MEFTIITSVDYLPVSWPGGTTTELFIFPPTSNYQKRDFQFRLSTATVEKDSSDFTLLYGISRKLMVLAGEVTLIHEGHYSKHLNKFDIDEFEGEWKTSSIGKCIDFNLMTKGKIMGSMAAIIIEKEQHLIHSIKENLDWFLIYVFSGNPTFNINNTIITIKKGDLLIISKLTTGEIEITGNENSELVLTGITL